MIKGTSHPDANSISHKLLASLLDGKEVFHASHTLTLKVHLDKVMFVNINFAAY